MPQPLFEDQAGLFHGDQGMNIDPDPPKKENGRPKFVLLGIPHLEEEGDTYQPAAFGVKCAGPVISEVSVQIPSMCSSVYTLGIVNEVRANCGEGNVGS